MTDLAEQIARVSHEEAREIMSRLVAGSFRRDGEQLEHNKRPRFSIPARPEHDDDLRLAAYIEQQASLPAIVEVERLREALENIKAVVAVQFVGGSTPEQDTEALCEINRVADFALSPIETERTRG